MARSLDDTGKHLIRILRQGGATAVLVTELMLAGRDSIIAKILKAQKAGATPGQVSLLIHKEAAALLKANQELLVKQGIGAAEFQADSSTKYLAVLGVQSPKPYKVTERFVKASFKTPFPFQNIAVNDLLTGQMAALDTQLVNVTRQAIASGETLRSTSRFIEIASGQLSDSTLSRKANALARSAIAQVANDTRFAVFDAEEEVSGVLFVATLDHRTSPICQSLDGEFYASKSEARVPPLHVGCRSTLVPVLQGEALADVKDQLQRPAVEIKSAAALDKKGLKTSGGKVRKPSRSDRSPLKGVQKKTYVTYSQWLKTQPIVYQREILGPKAFDKFRSSGNLKTALGVAE